MYVFQHCCFRGTNTTTWNRLTQQGEQTNIYIIVRKHSNIQLYHTNFGEITVQM